MKIIIPNLRSIRLSELSLWLIFLINPFVDALTGYMVNSGILEEGGFGTPSQLYRFLTTLVILVQIRNKKSWLYIACFVYYFLSVELFSFSLHTNVSFLVIGIVYAYKMLFGLILYFYLKELIESSQLNIKKLLNHIITSGTIYAVIVLISDVLGISYSSYPGMQLGSKGIFAGGNGMGVFVGVVSLITLYRYFTDYNKKDLLRFFLMGYVLIGLMSKAGMLFLGVGLIILFFKQSRKIKLISLSASFVFGVLFYQTIAKFLTVSFSVLSWRLERTESLWEFILGGRETYLAEAANIDYSNVIQMLKLIVGGGYKVSFRNPMSIEFDGSGIFIIEADLFDIFFMMGIAGLLTYLGIIIYGFVCAHRTRVKGIDILKIAWFLLFIHSSLAGHVLNNGMALMTLPCLLIFLQYRTYNKFLE